MKRLILLMGLLLPGFVQAQSYSINWFKVAGGGGTSSGTNAATTYTISGTVGQPDASLAMVGGNFSLTGGFWSLVSLVQNAGAPLLSIAQSGNSVIVSWPYPAPGFVLQSTTSLSPTNWSNFSGTTVTNVSTISVTVTPPVGNSFFRLAP